jgi:hypothetical protein
VLLASIFALYAKMLVSRKDTMQLAALTAGLDMPLFQRSQLPCVFRRIQEAADLDVIHYSRFRNPSAALTVSLLKDLRKTGKQKRGDFTCRRFSAGG